jgi:predicted aminopeptidase
MERPLRFTRRLLVRGLILSVLVLALLPVVSAEARFVLRAGYEEARILLKRRPLEELIADPSTSPERRAQFELVLATRAFAAERLGLEAGNTYTTFSDVGTGKLLEVLSASPRYRLAAYRWRYPVVGAIPYKGFFDEEAALAEQRRLDRLGYDTYLRPSGAFSTLGWFDDPLLSTALDGDPAELVVTVIHEIAHNTLWVPGDARFNESYANFVGFRGAEAFFASRGDHATAARCAAMWRDEKRLAAFYTRLESDLEALYESRIPDHALETRREALFARAHAILAGPLDRELEVYSGSRLGRRPLNNARLIANRIYMSGLEELDQVYALAGEDVRASVRQIALSVRKHPSLSPAQALALMVRSSGALAVPASTGAPEPAVSAVPGPGAG